MNKKPTKKEIDAKQNPIKPARRLVKGCIEMLANQVGVTAIHDYLKVEVEIDGVAVSLQLSWNEDEDDDDELDEDDSQFAPRFRSCSHHPMDRCTDCAVN